MSRWTTSLVWVMVLLLGVGASMAPAQEGMPAGLVVWDKGYLDWGGLRFSVQHYDSQWQTAEQSTDVRPEQGYPRREEGKWELRGQLHTRAGVFVYQQSVRRVAGGQGEAVEYEASVHSQEGVASNGLGLTIALPVDHYGGEQIVIDGQALKLPERKQEQYILLSSQPASKLQIATEEGRIIIEGPLMLMVQDNRQFGNDAFQIRLDFAPSQGLIKESSLKLTLRYVADEQAAQTETTTTRPANGK